MGKRKSSSKPQAKAKMAPLDKSFKCLFCQHMGTVTCKIDNKKQTGRLDCKDCGQNFSCDTNHLTEAIDIYSEWIDACTDVNPPDAPASRSVSPEAPTGGTGRLKKKAADQDASGGEEEDELPDFRRRKVGEVVDETVEEREDDDEEEEDLPDPKRRKQVVESDEDD